MSVPDHSDQLINVPAQSLSRELREGKTVGRLPPHCPKACLDFPSAAALPPLKTPDPKIFSCMHLNIFVLHEEQGTVTSWIKAYRDPTATYFKEDSYKHQWQKFPNRISRMEEWRQGAIVIAGFFFFYSLSPKMKNWEEGRHLKERREERRGSVIYIEGYAHHHPPT